MLWALMVLLMNMHDVSESVAGLAIALLTLMVCSSAGERVKRFWPRQFFVMFYAVHGGTRYCRLDVKTGHRSGAGTLPVNVTKGTSSLCPLHCEVKR